MAPVWHYENFKLTADFHVQVALEPYELPFMETYRDDSELRLRGTVVTIFRGKNRIAIGDAVEFSAVVSADHLHTKETEWNITSGVRNLFDNKIKNNAKYMEVFLNGSPPDCQLPAIANKVIDAPSETAQIKVPTHLRLSCDGRQVPYYPNVFNQRPRLWRLWYRLWLFLNPEKEPEELTPAQKEKLRRLSSWGENEK